MPDTYVVIPADEFREMMDTVLRRLDEIEAKIEAPPEPAKTGETLTRKEAAKRLRITEMTLWRMEQKGVLIPSRIGRRVIYRAEDVDQLIEQGSVVPSDPSGWGSPVSTRIELAVARLPLSVKPMPATEALAEICKFAKCTEREARKAAKEMGVLSRRVGFGPGSHVEWYRKGSK